MKIRNKLLSLVVALLAGCCFFGTCVEAKPKKAKDSNGLAITYDKNDLVIIYDRDNREEKEERYQKLKMLKYLNNLGKNKHVSVKNFSRYNDCKKWFRKASCKEFLKKYGIEQQINIKEKDREVLKAFEKFIDKKYDGSVDSCFIVDSLESFLATMKMNITRKKWKKAVIKVVKELKDEGKRPFRKGVGDIKEMLVQGRSLSSSIDFVNDVDSEKEHTAYSKEFIKRLAKELKVDFNTLYENMGFGFVLGVKFKK